MRSFLIAVAVAVLAGCSSPGTGDGGGTVTQPPAPAQVLDAAFAAFQTHAQDAYDQFRSLASNLADDMVASNHSGMKTDGKALQTLAAAETSWVAGHPASSCETSAVAAWAAAIALVKKAGGEAVALKSSSASNDAVTANKKLVAVIDSLPDLAGGACLH